jgi:hypothetical protein
MQGAGGRVGGGCRGETIKQRRAVALLQRLFSSTNAFKRKKADHCNIARKNSDDRLPADSAVNNTRREREEEMEERGEEERSSSMCPLSPPLRPFPSTSASGKIKPTLSSVQRICAAEKVEKKKKKEKEEEMD